MSHCRQQHLRTSANGVRARAATYHRRRHRCQVRSLDCLDTRARETQLLRNSSSPSQFICVPREREKASIVRTSAVALTARRRDIRSLQRPVGAWLKEPLREGTQTTSLASIAETIKHDDARTAAARMCERARGTTHAARSIPARSFAAKAHELHACCRRAQRCCTHSNKHCTHGDGQGHQDAVVPCAVVAQQHGPAQDRWRHHRYDEQCSCLDHELLTTRNRHEVSDESMYARRCAVDRRAASTHALNTSCDATQVISRIAPIHSLTLRSSQRHGKSTLAQQTSTRDAA
jgi:hypothetical protein